MPTTSQPCALGTEESAEESADGLQDVPSPDDPLATLRAAEAQHLADKACARPDLSMHYDEVGRFHLRYSAPAEVGALVEQAVKEAKDALFTAAAGAQDVPAASELRASQHGCAQASRPTYADAIAEIANRSLASITSTSRASHYRVYVHLDTGGAWVNGGGAITPRMADRFSCDGTVTPLWESEGRPISVGRDQRILPARTRRLIEDRDRGCRIPGCSTTRFVEIHHLDHWADGGATDYDSQVSLCPFHHDARHRGDITITGDPTRPDGLTVTNRYGLPIAPPTPSELAPRSRPAVGRTDHDQPVAGSPGVIPPDTDPSDAEPPDADSPDGKPYPSPSGGTMRACDVEFVPDAWQSWRPDQADQADQADQGVPGSHPPSLRLVGTG